MLGDGGLEGVVDVPDAVAEDVAEPDQHRQLDPAQHQMIGQLLQIDGAVRVLRGMNQHVASRRDREVALAPAVDFIQFRGVVDGKDLACLPVTVRLECGVFTENMIQRFVGASGK